MAPVGFGWGVGEGVADVEELLGVAFAVEGYRLLLIVE